MPHINRIRVNNVKYNFGTQFYDDFILRFDEFVHGSSHRLVGSQYIFGIMYSRRVAVLVKHKKILIYDLIAILALRNCVARSECFFRIHVSLLELHRSPDDTVGLAFFRSAACASVAEEFLDIFKVAGVHNALAFH